MSVSLEYTLWDRQFASAYGTITVCVEWGVCPHCGPCSEVWNAAPTLASCGSLFDVLMVPRCLGRNALRIWRFR